MKISKIIAAALFFMIISGCTSYSTGELKSSYSPTPIDVEGITEVVTIKVASGLTIWKVDGARKVSAVKMMLGKGLDSVLLSEGLHQMTGSIDGKDLKIKRANYVAGHEYFIDYVKKEGGGMLSVFYWVKDLTDNKVILGKEMTVEELKKK